MPVKDAIFALMFRSSFKVGKKLKLNYTENIKLVSGGANYMSKLIFVCDLGHFRAYRLSKTDLGTAKLDMIESIDSVEAHGKFSDKLSDRAGNFGRTVGQAAAARGSGEAHNIVSETEKRVIKKIAGFINKIVKDENPNGWYLAAEKSINGQLQDSIDTEVRLKLEKQVQANLTKSEKSEIIKRFI